MAFLPLLLLYPVLSLAAPELFFWLWPKMRPPSADSPFSKTEQGKEMSVRLGVLLPLFVYVCLLFGTMAWRTFLSADQASVFFLGRWLANSLVALYLGTSWAGVSIWLLALGARTGRMRREIPGLLAPLKFQSVVWLSGAFAEETWRVVAIAALLKSDYSPFFSIVAVSLSFGSAYLGLGLQRASVASLDGVFFGFLYLWRGSLLAPFLAHLAVQAVYLWGVGQFSPDRQTRKTWQIPGTKCPVCHSSLKLLQIKLSDVFKCPSCKEALSLSDTYQNIMRFAGAFMLVFVLFCSTFLLMIWLPFNIAVCVFLSYGMTLGIETSGLLLFRRIFVRIFPPQLQRGTPYFITMNLESRHINKSPGAEENSKGRASHDEN